MHLDHGTYHWGRWPRFWSAIILVLSGVIYWVICSSTDRHGGTDPDLSTYDPNSELYCWTRFLYKHPYPDNFSQVLVAASNPIDGGKDRESCLNWTSAWTNFGLCFIMRVWRGSMEKKRTLEGVRESVAYFLTLWQVFGLYGLLKL